MIRTPHTQETLLRDLSALGVEQGDTVFTHSSFKSLGPVQGGAATVIGALEEVVGPEGLLLMPSFNLVAWPKRVEFWDIDTTPSAVGWLTECFRRMPGTHRSDHYSASVAARVRGAKGFVSGHLGQEGLRSRWDREPWGKTYGTASPMYRAYRTGGKLLMLGVDYESSSYCHLVEVLHWNRLLDQGLDVPFRGLSRPALGEFWEGAGRLVRARVGDADSRLFPIRDYVDTLLDEVTNNPDPYFE